MRRAMERRLPVVLATVWVVLVIAALLVTLRSIGADEFDGLNNTLQIPLALPWWLAVPAPKSHRADALVTAGLGLLNAGLLYVASRRFIRRRNTA